MRNQSEAQLANLAPQFQPRKRPKYFISTDQHVSGVAIEATLTEQHTGKGPLFIREDGGAILTIDPPRTKKGLATVRAWNEGGPAVTVRVDMESLAAWMHWVNDAHTSGGVIQ